MADDNTGTTGVSSLVASYKVIRDDIIYIAGTPFNHLYVYELFVNVPFPTYGVPLFSVRKDYIISSITIAASEPFRYDCDYGLYDIADNETIGNIKIRGGKEGLFPVAVPDLPAGLDGPSTVFCRFVEGVQPNAGHLIFRISVNGPPNITEEGLIIDLNNDGIPDVVNNDVIPLPILRTENYDDFIAGYNLGFNGVEV
jgi:hypothetical protein